MTKNKSYIFQFFFCLAGLFFLPSFLLGAENIAGNEAWRKLALANSAYEEKELGEALLYCEQARIQHTREIGGFIDNLRQAVSPSEVKKAGDDIRAVYDVLKKRNDSGATGILDAVLLNYPVEYFGKSIQTLLAWLERRLVYPEADFLSGKIYEAEGENNLALSCYEKAWENKDFLDIPDERYSLAYRMADLSYTMGNCGEQEKYLLLVLLNDSLFGKPGDESPTLEAMLHTLRIDPTAEKFFSLYRHSNYAGLKAYQDLTSFYFYSNNMGRALSVASLSACISVTELSDALKQADFEYAYTGFGDLLVRTGKKPEIVGWARNQKIWDSFLLLASVLQKTGESAQAKSICESIAANCPDKTAQRKAMTILSTMAP